MDSVKQEIDKYRSAISEYLEQNHLEDAAMNVRHILELILSEYVKRFAPEYVFAKSIDKITKLNELKIIDEISENSLHQMRKLGNRAAHRDANLPICKEEIEIILPVIDLETNSLIKRITEMESAENTENNTQRPFSEEWVLSLFNASNTIFEMNHLISILENYSEEQASEFINRCKEKKQKIYERTHAKEIYLDEIKKKNCYPANKLIAFSWDYVRARCITGQVVLLPKGDVEGYLKPNINVLTWKDVKKTRKNYALFYNGKIGIAYLDKKAEYLSDYTYGIWDDIVDFELSRDSKNNKECVYAITTSGKVRTTYIGSELKEYASWNNICKIYVEENFYGTAPVLIGIEKDGTAHMMSRHKWYGSEKDDLCSKLSKIKNICDIQFVGNSLIVLTADGKVIEFVDGKYSKKCFQGLEDWEDIIQIRAIFTHIIGLKSNGTVVGIKADGADVRRDCCDTEDWTDIVAIHSSINLSIGLKATGHIISCGKDSQKYNARICYNVFKFEEECEKWKRRKQILSQIENIKQIHSYELQRIKNTLSQVDNQIKACEQELNLLYEEKNRKSFAFSTYRIFDIPNAEKKLKNLLNRKNDIVNELNFIQDQIEAEIEPYQKEIEVIDKMFKDDERELLLTSEDSIED